MKPASQQNLLILVFSVCALLNIFQKPLGLPEWSEWLFLCLSLVSAVTFLAVQRRAKERRDPGFVSATPSQNRRATWLLLTVLFVSCAAWPFILPYTGINLPFNQLVIISALIFTGSALLLIIVRRRRE